MKNLLIVESPAKAKTIGKYLGKDYEVIASFGHIRDLPSKPGSVNPDNDFAMDYQISPKSTKHVSEMVTRAKNCENLILAPDPDREGESIAWHVLETLKQKKALKPTTKIQRVVFNAITKNSVIEAIKQPRKIDMNLVDAQQARRALDYLVGFTLSPILWKKLPGSRSAGRVQSVALRIICDREDEIEAFKSEEYWDVKVDLTNRSGQKVIANLTHINGKKLEKFSIINEVQAKEISKILEEKAYNVSEINRKEVKRRPYAPFITSSLQQEASRKLGFTARKTMQIAQKLYEGIDIDGESQGLITYMRTDGVYVAPEAIDAVRNFIGKEYGNKYLPANPIVYNNKVKNAQEAHEAIRPADFSLPPIKIKKYLEADFFALYDLIWKRTVASQMQDVVMDQVSAIIITKSAYAELRAVGSVIKFDGFYVLYKEVDEDNVEEDEKILPELKSGDVLDLVKVNPAQHFTEPPPRYNEASLVKKLEELGIGRPSTYASIISVLQDREYVKLEKRRFIPEERGRLVTMFLKEFFATYVEYDYTAKLEDDLDIISNGKLDWKKFLQQFWLNFNRNIKEVGEKSITEILDVINKKVSPHIFGIDENGNVKNKCPSCETGVLGIKIGRYGVFVGCSNYPECKHTSQIDQGGAGNETEEGQFKERFDEPKSLGFYDDKGSEIFLKKGPYGFYIELLKKDSEEEKPKEKVEKKVKGKISKAKSKDKAPKPKRVSVPKGMAMENLDLKTAKKLLTLPREIGINPETGLKIMASIGPFGPYLLHNGIYASVKEDDILEIGLDRAISVIAEDSLKKAAKVGVKKKSYPKKTALKRKKGKK